MSLFLVLVLIMYFFVFYIVFLKSNIQRTRYASFYKSVLSVYKECHVLEDALEQLSLNYNKIFQKLGATKDLTLLDMLEQLIHYYDSYSDKNFKYRFGETKDPKIRSFILKICKLIKKNEPFSSVASKESNMLKNINDAIIKNNKDLGLSTLQQLAEEIANKEKTIKKKEKENQVATIVSIVGVALTIFFGLLSLV